MAGWVESLFHPANMGLTTAGPLKPFCGLLKFGHSPYFNTTNSRVVCFSTATSVSTVTFTFYGKRDAVTYYSQMRDFY
jgi:hypothetical protein